MRIFSWRVGSLALGMRAQYLAAALTSVVLLSANISVSVATGPPNIVMILADDMSWVGTSVQMDPDRPDSKSDYYRTPVLEQLASQGMVFSHAYAASPVCSASRAAMESGMSPAAMRVTDLRQGNQQHLAYFQDFYNGYPLTPPLPRNAIINPMEKTLGNMLKEVNSDYRTAVFGKFDWWPAATSSGYDEAIAFSPTGGANKATDPKSMFSIANAGMDFMGRKAAEGKPFFVNFSHYAIKPSTEARPATVAEFQALPRGTKHFDPAHAAMHKDLDTTIGMVLDKITELGIEDNTYVVFASDHGASTDVISTLNNVPLFGGKGTLFEGGVRVPLIVRGPGIAQSAYSGESVSLMDLFPTFYELAGGTAPLPDKYEGTSITGLLENGGELPPGQTTLSRSYGPNGELFFHYPNNTLPIPFIANNGPHSAIIDGDFKLIRRYGNSTSPDTVQLFNIADNIAEADNPSSPLNLAPSMPEKVAELEAKLDNWLEGVDASQAYDVRTPVQLSWRADQRGSFHGVPDVWRATTDVDSFDREVWVPSSSAPGPANNAPPSLAESNAHQPGLSEKAFHFSGTQGFARRYFHVSDAKKPDLIDADHSATFEMWVKLSDLNTNQLLFESGTAEQGLSLTFGDADGDSKRDDLRFRILGKTGNALTVTADVNRFADITKDFVQVTAVVNDSNADRYAELYINGTLAGRVDGVAGADELDWDGFLLASLGRLSVNSYPWTGNNPDTLGAAGGTGALPFQGGNLRGDIASFQFYNYHLNPSQVLANYNAVLEPVDYGISGVTGAAQIGSSRPSTLSLNATQSPSLVVIDERSDRLDAPLAVDALVTGASSYRETTPGTAGVIPAGTNFTSYLMQFDPPSDDAGVTETVQGSVQFQQRILAVLFEPGSLAGSDAVLASVGDYGALSNRGIDLIGNDELTISPDRRTLSFDLSILGDEMLQFRVLTQNVIAADFDGNGRVDGADLAIFETAYGVSDAGDTDFDGDTDGFDFLAWQRQFTPESEFRNEEDLDREDLANWEVSYGLNSGGDFDGDGDTDGQDFLAWQRRYVPSPQVAVAQTVPEPTAISLIVAMLLAVSRSRPRRD